MKIWIFYLKNYKAFQHILTLVIAFGIFRIGGINLFQADLKILPLQLFLIIVCYPLTVFILKALDFETSINKEKKARGIED
jgi:hypothetical protein